MTGKKIVRITFDGEEWENLEELHKIYNFNPKKPQKLIRQIINEKHMSIKEKDNLGKKNTKKSK